MASQMRISVENNLVLTDARVNGIDTTNVLVSYDYQGSGTYNYTAVEDCIAFYITSMEVLKNIFMNEVPLVTTSKSSYPAVSYCFPMKTGDVFKVVQGNNQDTIIKVWGIKR